LLDHAAAQACRQPSWRASWHAGIAYGSRALAAALRHERLVARLARGRLQRAPGALVTAIVTRVAAGLGPRWPQAPAGRPARRQP
jgi:hypothetical protein